MDSLLSLFVFVLGSSPPPFTPSSDILQGTILSPLLFSLFLKSVAFVLRTSKLLLYVNDMKLFFKWIWLTTVSFYKITKMYQLPGANLSDYPLIFPNVPFLFFPGPVHTLMFTYHIHGVLILLSSGSIRNLGFIFTCNLPPYRHIEDIFCKALEVLGFVFRGCVFLMILSC